MPGNCPSPPAAARVRPLDFAGPFPGFWSFLSVLSPSPALATPLCSHSPWVPHTKGCALH